MSLLLKDRVKESTTTTGTGTLTLVAAPSGYRRFSAALSDGDTTYYCIESGSQWEVGLGTYSANTLTRDTVLASSNSGSKINITASRSYVFITYAAEKAVYENAAGEIKVDSAIRFSDNSSQSTAFLGAVDYDGIANVPANSFLGNNTGSVGDAVAMDASASRTLLGLSTSDSPTFAGLTLNGNLLFGTTNTYDVGNGTYDPRSVYAATSVLTPAVSNTASQLTLTGGPDAGYFSLASVVLKNTASANDYGRFYGVGGISIMALHAGGYSPGLVMYTGSNGQLTLASQGNPGHVILKGGSTSGKVYCYNSASAMTTLYASTVENADAAATTLGNATYGVTVPGRIVSTGSGIRITGSPATLAAGFYLDITRSESTGAVEFTDYQSGSPTVQLSHLEGVWSTTGQFKASKTATGVPVGLVINHNNSNARYEGAAIEWWTYNGTLRTAQIVGATDDGGFSGMLLFRTASPSGGASTPTTKMILDDGGVLAFGSTLANTVPALVPSGTTLRARLGDNSADAPFSAGAATFSGDISMSKTSAQGYIRAYATDGVKNVAISHNGSSGAFTTSSGANTFFSGTGQHYFFDSTGAKYLLFTQSGNAASITSIASAASYLQIVTESGQVNVASNGVANSTFNVLSGTGGRYTTLTHDGTNGILSTSSGNLNLVPTGGTVAVTGGITASGVIAATGTSIGSVRLVPGDASYTGYIGWYDSAGTRTAYAGYNNDGNLTLNFITTGKALNVGGNVVGRNLASSSTGGTNGLAAGTLDLLSAAATAPYICFTELTVANRGAFGFAAGSSTLSYRAGGTSMTTGTEVFTIGNTGNVGCAGITASGGATITGGGVTGTYGVKLGSVDNASTGAVWVSSVTPSSSNFMIAGDTNYTAINTPNGTLYFKIAGVEAATISKVAGVSHYEMTVDAFRSTAYAIFNYSDYNGGGTLNWSAACMNAVNTQYRTLFNKSDLGTIVTASTGIYGWNGSADITFSGTNDTGLARDAAGVVEINHGTLVSGGGSYGALKCAGITASGLIRGAETTSTPSGTTQTITLESGNCQTLDLTSSTGDVTVTLTVPASSAFGSLLVKQHATTARDITWAASAGSIVWLGTEPTWNADATSSYREVSWRFNGTDIFLSASGVS